MGSDYKLFLDDTLIIINKSPLPRYLSAMFQESDRTSALSGKNGQDHVYRAERRSVLERLDLMGLTEDIVSEQFFRWNNEMFRHHDYQARHGGSVDRTLHSLIGRTNEDEVISKAMLKLDWEDWLQRVPRNLGRSRDAEGYDDIVDRHMRGSEAKWLWFAGRDSPITLRAIIQGSTHIRTVTLDVSNLVNDDVNPDYQFCAEHNRIVSMRGQSIGPTIILAGGESDIEILKTSQRRFHPDLEGFIKIFNHSEFTPGDGAENVLKLLTTFAAAHVPALVVAIFNNDTAGLAAYQQAKLLDLPPNFTCIHLPNIKLAKSYPTVGRHGIQNEDINGKAGSIELYLGRQALTSDGALRAVQWADDDNKTNTRQGEIKEIEAVREAFLLRMRLKSKVREKDYPELMKVWKIILKAVKRTSERLQKQAPDRPFNIN